MSLAYLGLAALWAGLYAWHWREVFTLQHCITAVIALGLMEMSTWRAPPRALHPTQARGRPTFGACRSCHSQA